MVPCGRFWVCLPDDLADDVEQLWETAIPNFDWASVGVTETAACFYSRRDRAQALRILRGALNRELSADLSECYYVTQPVG